MHELWGWGWGAAPPSCTDFTPINLREEVGGVGVHYLPPSIVTAREPSPFLLNPGSQMLNLNPYKKSHLTLLYGSIFLLVNTLLLPLPLLLPLLLLGTQAADISLD